jgi:hypothetical protein
MEKFFAKVKRLLEPRAQTPAETLEQPTADRPPPLEAPRSLEASRSLGAATPAESAPAEAIPAVDDVTEIRALLEPVAETPVRRAEPEDEAPPSPPEPRTLSTQASTEPVLAAPGAVSGRAGDALVLTLATPAAIFTVVKASATIGRGQENTIRLDDLSVSRRHARIAYRQGGYWLSDLGSMGGTWVDGTRLNAPRRIAAGEVIDIGLCRLTVSFAVDPLRADTKKSASRSRSKMEA